MLSQRFFIPDNSIEAAWSDPYIVLSNVTCLSSDDMPNITAAIETTTPFNVQIYKLDDSLLFKGWMDYDCYTDKFKEWNGEPQGYSSDIVEVKTETEEIL